MTPLLLAIQKGNPDSYRFLLGSGASEHRGQGQHLWLGAKDEGGRHTPFFSKSARARARVSRRAAASARARRVAPQPACARVPSRRRLTGDRGDIARARALSSRRVFSRAPRVRRRYSPQFFIRTADVSGSITLLGEQEMVMPGDNSTLKVSLQSPVALDEGVRFAMREGGKTVGAGVVSKILG